MSGKSVKIIAKKLYHAANLMTKSSISLLSCLLFCSFSAARRLKRFRKNNSVQEKECYILGNGPALNDALTYLKDKSSTDFFVVNMFANNEIFFTLRPNNYIIIDSTAWNTHSHPSFSEQNAVIRLQEAVSKLLNAFSRVDWPMNLFIPAHCPKSFTKNVSPHINVIRINTVPIEGIKWLKHFLYSKGWGMPTPVNVTNAAIFVAIFLKYPKIYLYGVNHSWMCDFKVDENNRIYTEDSHFYKNEAPRYYIKRGALEGSLRSMAAAFASHTALEEFSRTMGVRVYNRTQGSFIDAYEFDC